MIMCLVQTDHIILDSQVREKKGNLDPVELQKLIPHDKGADTQGEDYKINS